MAENETLDLWDTHSGRWRQLLSKIENDEPVEKIADEVVRCLYTTFKHLVELLPLERLLEAARKGDPTVRDVVRECREAREYAELFDQLVAIHCDPTALVEGVARAAVERFFEQISAHAWHGDGRTHDEIIASSLPASHERSGKPGGGPASSAP